MKKEEFNRVCGHCLTKDLRKIQNALANSTEPIDMLYDEGMLLGIAASINHPKMMKILTSYYDQHFIQNECLPPEERKTNAEAFSERLAMTLEENLRGEDYKTMEALIKVMAKYITLEDAEEELPEAVIAYTLGSEKDYIDPDYSEENWSEDRNPFSDSTLVKAGDSHKLSTSSENGGGGGGGGSGSDTQGADSQLSLSGTTSSESTSDGV